MDKYLLLLLSSDKNIITLVDLICTIVIFSISSEVHNIRVKLVTTLKRPCITEWEDKLFSSEVHNMLITI